MGLISFNAWVVILGCYAIVSQLSAWQTTRKNGVTGTCRRKFFAWQAGRDLLGAVALLCVRGSHTDMALVGAEYFAMAVLFLSFVILARQQKLLDGR